MKMFACKNWSVSIAIGQESETIFCKSYVTESYDSGLYI